MHHVVTAIKNLPHILQRDATHTRILNTQVPNFRGAEDKFHDFEYLLLDHLRPHQTSITEEHKLHSFQSLLQNQATDYRQTLRITPKTTLKNDRDKNRREFAKDDFKEVSKFKWDQFVYDPTNENFSDFLKTLKKTATKAFGDRAAEFIETFVFGKLPIQIQHELSTAGKSKASVEEIKTFI